MDKEKVTLIIILSCAGLAILSLGLAFILSHSSFKEVYISVPNLFLFLGLFFIVAAFVTGSIFVALFQQD